MKIRISFELQDWSLADAAVRALRNVLPGASVKLSKRHYPPFMHLYVTSGSCYNTKNDPGPAAELSADAAEAVGGHPSRR